MSKDFRNFTVSNARNSDIDRFKTHQAQAPNKLAHEAFARLLDAAEAKDGNPTELYNKYQDALAEIEKLKAEYIRISEFSQPSEALAGLQVENEALQVEISDLKAKLENRNNEPVIKGKAFIFEPSDAQYNQMRRTISYLIKQGKLSRAATDLPQQLTAKAITYLIKNEYEHILKWAI